MQPPLLPEEVLHRVLRLARMDGFGVLWIATFIALRMAYLGDLTGAFIWLFVAGAGAIELHGAILLQQGEKRGMGWLVASQLLFIAAIFAYCGVQLAHYDPALLQKQLTEEVKAMLVQARTSEEDYLWLVYRTTFGLIAGATLIYKGGLAIYFYRRRNAIAPAMEVESKT